MANSEKWRKIVEEEFRKDQNSQVNSQDKNTSQDDDWDIDAMIARVQAQRAAKKPSAVVPAPENDIEEKDTGLNLWQRIRNKLSPGAYDDSEIAGSWSNWIALAATNKQLNDNQKKQAKAAAKTLNKAARNVLGWDQIAGSSEEQQQANRYKALAAALENKSKTANAITGGIASSIPFSDFFNKPGSEIMDEDSFKAMYGDDAELIKMLQGYNTYESLYTAQPAAFKTANLVGTAAQLIGGNQAVSAATSAIKGFAKLAPWVRAAVNSGVTFGAFGGLHAADDVPTRKEWDEYQENQAGIAAEMGATYTKADYDPWRQVGYVAKETGINALGGAVGSVFSSAVGALGKGFLVKHQMQTPFMEALRQTLAGTAFAAGDTGATYFLYPEDQRPDREQIAHDLTAAFIFSAVTGMISTVKTTAAQKTYLDNAVRQTQDLYGRTINTNMTNTEKMAAFDEILKINKDIRTAISQNYYDGQQQYIDDIIEGLNALDDEIMLIKNRARLPMGAAEGPTIDINDTGAAPPPPPPTQNMPASGLASPPMQRPGESAVSPAPAAVARAGRGQGGPGPVSEETAKVIQERAADFGENGGKAFVDQYDGKTDTAAYYAGFAHFYNAGKDGRKIEEAGGEHAAALTEPQRFAAYAAGQNDAEMVQPQEEASEILPAEEESGIIEAEESAGDTAAYERVADALIGKYIRKGTEFNSGVLFQEADRAYDGTMASGAYTVKDAYDAMELAVNKFLLERSQYLNTEKDPAKVIAELEKLANLLPTQTKRTEEMESYQQFSTPPNIAYLAAWLGNITGSDTVVEPSAGIGGLAIFPKAWGAKVIVNELSKRRLDLLKTLGFDQVYNENAEQLNNVLPESVRPTVVLMNPPFSATAGRMAVNKTTNAKRHIEQALLRLEDGGRLVAVLGKGMADSAPSFKSWWDELRQTYDIRANISIDGSNYRKYGTTFGIQLVVMDKTGPQKGQTITGTFQTLQDIPRALEGIRNDRANIRTTEREGALKSSEKPAEQTGRQGAQPVPGASAGGSAGLAKQGQTGNRPGDRGRSGQPIPHPGGAGSGVSVAGKPGAASTIPPADGKPATGVQRPGAAGLVTEGQNQSGQTIPAAGNGGGQLEQQRRGADAAAPGDQGLKPAGRQKARKEDNGVYAEYIPAKLTVKGAKKHPAPLVESAAMAAVPAPPATYTPNLPRELIETGGLSDAQLENIIYAGQAHSQVLPDGNRRGYFIGDGTGVGKGRQLAGIILDNWRQGRKKAIWISKNIDLLEDAVRDWTDIGGDKDSILPQYKVKQDGKITAADGILFSTYDTLKSGEGAKSRIQQIVDWVGKDFDGVIALDEAHNMGNLLGKTGARGKTKPAAKAIAGSELQKALPQARVVYASATVATDVNELAYASRLGLWGRGTAFADVNDFVNKISSAGIAAMELVARDMKAMGSYLARSISYDGVTYETLTHDLTPVQSEIYDTMSQAWQITLQNINQALDITGAINNANARSSAKSAYYGAMQRFYNQVLTSMSMPSVIRDIKKELAKNHSVVLQIVNTNEATAEKQLGKAKEQGLSLDELDLTPREALLGYLEKSFPINAYEEYMDDEGNIRSRLVTDSAGNPVVDRQAQAMRDALAGRINEMSIPDGPLEMLYRSFGTEEVAEVTGRSRRIVPKKNADGSTELMEERRTNNHALADAQAFQDGKKHILIFSEKGGTGKSYHADRRAKNQQQRIHYVLQPGWSAAKATQGFGRTHRSNQAVTPSFRLVTTNIMGQKRFVSTIARRLDQMGALTKGQRQTGSGMFGEKDNLESALAKDSLRNFYKAMGSGKFFCVPKPREIAVLTSLFESLIEYYAFGNSNAMDEFYNYAVDNFMPGGMSDLAQGDVWGSIGSLGIIGVGSYMMANRDFLGKPIVSSGLQNLEAKDQYTNRTSQIAYWLGQALNTSPQMIDYFFQQTLGGWWKWQKALFPVGGENVDYTLGVQNTYIKDNQYSTDLVNRLYDYAEKAEKAKNSDPGNMKKQFAYKLSNGMARFYSSYYSLAKNSADTPKNRAVRQTVLDMVAEFNKSADSGQWTSEAAALQKFCSKAGSVEYLPAVMPVEIKNDDGKVYSLTADEYVNFQTEYLTLYWEYVGAAFSSGYASDTAGTALKLQAAKAKAREDAVSRELLRHGYTSANYRANQDMQAAGLTATEYILYQAAKDMYDLDSNGHVKQEEAQAAIDSLPGLTNAERAWLWQSTNAGWSEKNNPY